MGYIWHICVSARELVCVCACLYVYVKVTAVFVCNQNTGPMHTASVWLCMRYHQCVLVLVRWWSYSPDPAVKMFRLVAFTHFRLASLMFYNIFTSLLVRFVVEFVVFDLWTNSQMVDCTEIETNILFSIAMRRESKFRPVDYDLNNKKYFFITFSGVRLHIEIGNIFKLIWFCPSYWII